MSNKSKGSNAERELVKMFTANGWRAVRVAGSGVGDESPADLIVGKAGRKGCAVESKSTKSGYIYITRQQIEDFMLFSTMIGLEPVIAARFNYEGWFFLNPRDLADTGKYWTVNLQLAKEKGKRFGQFFQETNQEISE